ncbi:mechanosensitive ion channel [Pseudenhygromyxa sp. WMMC2535]|uniref:mechanosensitive ion channel family protein n=1 Tax=Pseudenhygromyxa sp. WMMC2535 TaxID=2712867 RepID=UPI0015524DA9|nr:mechanosensitive ion channel domain-containing protein [Pseudenhygromyxa sp. WMMC2535]NVB37155.1 mechanosensitive ion channel [Pseudenhygromyxa sp. WMMC2535]
MAEITVPPLIEPYMPIIKGAVVAILIFVLGWFVAKWAHSLTVKVLRKSKLDESMARFLGSLAQFGVLAATVIAALGTVGIETTSLVAMLGAAGVAIGLALQGNLSHFASGVMLLSFRPFTVGDVVEIGGKLGTVDEIGLFATTVITFDNLRVTIPNSSITSGAITNYSVLGRRRAVIDIGVAYGSDIDQVTELLLDAARSVEVVLEDPAPAAVFMSFGASSLDFVVRVWSKNADFGDMQHQVRRAIYNALDKAGIDIPFNQIVLHQADAAEIQASPANTSSDQGERATG